MDSYRYLAQELFVTGPSWVPSSPSCSSFYLPFLLASFFPFFYLFCQTSCISCSLASSRSVALFLVYIAAAASWVCNFIFVCLSPLSPRRKKTKKLTSMSSFNSFFLCVGNSFYGQHIFPPSRSVFFWFLFFLFWYESSRKMCSLSVCFRIALSFSSVSCFSAVWSEPFRLFRRCVDIVLLLCCLSVLCSIVCSSIILFLERRMYHY